MKIKSEKYGNIVNAINTKITIYKDGAETMILMSIF